MTAPETIWALPQQGIIASNGALVLLAQDREWWHHVPGDAKPYHNADLTIRRDDPVLVQVVEALRLYSCDDGCNDCTKPEQDRVCCGMTASLALAALDKLMEGTE